jgi:hypothetical protein
MKVSQRSFFLSLTIISLLAFASLARGDDTQPPPKTEQPATPSQRTRRGGAAGFDHLAAQLKLSAEQKSKLRPLLQDESKKLRTLRQDTNLTSKDRRTQIRETRAATDEQAKLFLSKDQFAEFLKLRSGSHAKASATGPKLAPPDSK